MQTYFRSWFTKKNREEKTGKKSSLTSFFLQSSLDLRMNEQIRETQQRGKKNGFQSGFVNEAKAGSISLQN